MIQVKIFFAHNDLRNFSYLITDRVSGYSWVIDPFDEIPIIDYIKKESLVLKGILNTHQHWDHIRGNSALQSVFHCPVISNGECKIPLDEKHTVQFMATPGHTMDHHVFLWTRENHVMGLFSGDTLFNSGVGNCKNGGNVDLLFETTMELLKLPDETVLYPGHDYVKRNLEFAKTYEPENSNIEEALRMVRDSDSEKGLTWTLGQEKKTNPFLRLSSEEIRQNLSNGSKSERELFKKLRALRDNW